ncbi:MAG: TRAP transporter small permease subunit [Pseudorhodoplanes sp.]
MRTLFRLNGWLVQSLCVLAVLLVAAMMVSISAEVILRIFGFPSIIGLIELTEYALFISTFFVAPYLLRTNEHIRVDLVVSRLEPAAARRIECGVLAIIMSISLVTGVIGTMILIKSYQGGTLVFKDLIFPQWWLDWIIPLSSLAMLLQALEMLIDLVRLQPEVVHASAEGVPGIRPDELP